VSTTGEVMLLIYVLFKKAGLELAMNALIALP
jgi:hypothetical protein